MMQYILAGNGYNVLSIDFSDRKPPLLQSKIFKMSLEQQKSIKNEYIEHLSKNKITFDKVMNKLKLSLINFSLLKLIRGYLNKDKYGSIKFIRADFSDLSFVESNTIDAIVSTSAIEHNPDHQSLKKAITEFDRILKPNSAMFINKRTINPLLFILILKQVLYMMHCVQLKLFFFVYHQQNQSISHTTF